MQQILQNLKNGDTQLAHIPAPACRPGHLLIATRRSLISAGTERMLVEFGQANLLAKAKAQPDRVRQVLDKVKTDGLLPTMEAVFARLDQPLPLGYCNAGVVLEVGAGVSGFSVGDRVISNGPHAEVVCVPPTLCARIPDHVSDDEAAFTVLAAVGLQGVRLAQPGLGENVAVAGLGLIGLMTVQLLIANGCRVLGLDFDARRLELARRFGAQTVDLSAGADPVAAGLAFSQGRGVDAVLITASTKSSEPVRQAAHMSRQRGRIILVGVTGLELSRADFYEKELTFQVSCSYGPGRYDPEYEQKGHDYPFGLVRWTEQRNFEAVLSLLANRRLNVQPLISKHVAFEQAPAAYRQLLTDPAMLGVLLAYPDQGPELTHTLPLPAKNGATPLLRPAAGQAVVGVIGAGNFTSLVLLPALVKTPARLKTIASATGVSAGHAARKFGFAQATTAEQAILDDPEINTVFITTPHNSHARLVIAALQAGKHVFVEKPLALNCEELTAIKSTYFKVNPQPNNPPPLLPTTYSLLLAVGFNRRFSPLGRRMAALLAGRSEPVSIIYTVNAGAIPARHWTQDPQVGGGRIIGEGCHFIDFLRYLVGQPITGVEARMIGQGVIRQDKMSILLEFGDGSTGTVHYLANGHKSYPKERVEVFSQGRVLVLDNFKKLSAYGWPGFKSPRLWRQDKGHAAEVAAFIQGVTSAAPPLIPWPELEEVTLAAIAAVERAARPPQPLLLGHCHE